MANTKIPALTVATTPLAGTEVLPVVQSGVTKQVSVADLTAGRAVSASSLTLTGSPLGVTSGGTGTSTAIAAGSVIFSGTSCVYSSNNGSFFWDNSTQRLGLGTNTPNRRLELAGLTGGPALRLTNTNGNSGIEILTTSTKYSWLLGAQYNIDQTFEITSSTTNGGTTFSTPLFTISGSSGDIGFRVGNLIQGTAAKGINFTANTGAAGKTSQLLNWYEEGTWTPTDASGAGLTFTNAFGYYTRTGNIVTLMGRVTFPATASGLGVAIGGLPFTVANNSQPGGGCIRITDSGRNDTVVASATTTQITFYSTSIVQATNANYSGKRVDWVVQYMV